MNSLFKPMKIVSLVLVAIIIIVFFAATQVSSAPSDKGKPEKDKIPPVVSDLRVESITTDSAVILWTTDEPADSDVKYGLTPKTNINGPFDSELVLSHAIVLSDLISEANYTFCIRTRDANNNKTEECGNFTTLDEDTPPPPPPPPPPSSSSAPASRGADVLQPTRAALAGFASPNAKVSVDVKQILFGDDFHTEATAREDGSFSLFLKEFPEGLTSFSISATDQNGDQSVRKGYQFKLYSGGKTITKEQILIPPTFSLERDTITWGDNLLVQGFTMPNVGVLVEIEDSQYETESEPTGAYEILINTAHLLPGKVSVRVRSTAISDYGFDYSSSKTATLTLTRVPQADLNKDGEVNIRDFSIFLAKPSDMNNDGIINAFDVSIFLRALI